ncbi:hypothetical protein MITS9504_03230 [Synechococcus sp. MIT S9504]|nr:hypothetical protein MITS9504_03230 [Synechococcus sp. MIT S9504]
MSGEQFDHVLLLSAEGQIADKNAHLTAGPEEKGPNRIRQAIGTGSNEGSITSGALSVDPVSRNDH